MLYLFLFGHIDSQYKGARCLICGEGKHAEGITCPRGEALLTCINCRGSHRASSFSCPEYLLQRRAREFAAFEGVSLSEAFERLRGGGASMRGGVVPSAGRGGGFTDLPGSSASGVGGFPYFVLPPALFRSPRFFRLGCVFASGASGSARALCEGFPRLPWSMYRAFVGSGEAVFRECDLINMILITTII